MLERNTALREILCETAPRSEIKLVRLTKLGQVSVKARAARQQFENPILVKNVYLVFPNHVIDGRELPAITDQERRESSDFIVHLHSPSLPSSGAVAGRAGLAEGRLRVAVRQALRVAA